MLRHAECAGSMAKGDCMSFTRRELGKLALAGVPSAALLARTESLFGALAQAKPNSVFNGVQIGTITYSYRSMLDQSAEATLKYILDSGISAIELMGGPAESFAGAPESGRGGGAGRGAAAAGGPGGAPDAAGGGRRGGRGPVDPANLPPGAKVGSWNGTTCVIQPEGGARGGGAQGGGGGGRGRGEQTPEQQAAQQ